MTCEHFNFTGRHLFIKLAFRTRTHGAGNLDTELVTQFRSQLVSVALVRIEENLNDAFTVTHIDENQTAQITTTINPATQRHFLAHVGRIQFSTIYSTHNGILLILLPGHMALGHRNGYSLWSLTRKKLRHAE